MTNKFFPEEQIREAYFRHLKPEKPDLDKLAVQIAPLCRMFELLNMLLGGLSHGGAVDLTQNSILSHAVVYLRRHYAEQISASDVAQVCHCSVSTLSPAEGYRSAGEYGQRYAGLWKSQLFL